MGPAPKIPTDLPGIDSLDVDGKRVLVRCDLNVPLKDGRITDDLRIRAALPTLRALLDRGARLAVCSHLGRPKGKVVDELSLKPVGNRLSELLDRHVEVAGDVIGESARLACASNYDVVLLENLRFEEGEERNDPDLAAALAALADAYVDDAFGAAHRAHASISGVAELLTAAAGYLLVEEVAALERLLHSPEHPFVAVLGGAKVSDKLSVIGNLLDRVDTICIGGAMAFTLLVAQGHDVGRSLVEHDRVDEVRDVLGKATDRGVSILLPSDVVAADAPDSPAGCETVPLDAIGDRLGVDIGPETSTRFAEAITAARTALWNGPMGIFEIPEFAGGTRAVAEAVASATKNGAYTVAGGGDSAAALKQLGMEDAVSHLSTGGGASLELLEGRELPGVAVLRAKGRPA
ncbi:MAG TPA: phosphoglycerate kinase [Actinomycetota bacterium]|nr:phosphoglycerate kinase [Actinomycetota bacterium]